MANADTARTRTLLSACRAVGGKMPGFEMICSVVGRRVCSTSAFQTALTDAAAGNLSAAATQEWLADMGIGERSQHTIERRFRSSRQLTENSRLVA